MTAPSIVIIAESRRIARASSTKRQTFAAWAQQEAKKGKA